MCLSAELLVRRRRACFWSYTCLVVRLVRDEGFHARADDLLHERDVACLRPLDLLGFLLVPSEHAHTGEHIQGVARAVSFAVRASELGRWGAALTFAAVAAVGGINLDAVYAAGAPA